MPNVPAPTNAKQSAFTTRKSDKVTRGGCAAFDRSVGPLARTCHQVVHTSLIDAATVFERAALFRPMSATLQERALGRQRRVAA